jgi:hypothetical protein
MQIPISLNLESFIFIKTHCIHNIFHIFKLPVKTEIKWKIRGGIANGAFKIGNGMDAEYFPRDSGDSVILYPQLQNNDNKNRNKNFENKKVFLELSIKQLYSNTFAKQEYYQFLVTMDIFILRKFAKQTFRIKISVSNIGNQNDINNSHTTHIDNANSVVNFNSDNLISITTTTTTTTITNLKKIKVHNQGDNNLVIKSLNNCNICNLSITAVTNPFPFSINFLKSYLITSDIIKVSAENNNAKNFTNDNNSSIIISGSKYKKYSINGIQIQPRLFWKSNIGNLVYGNLGQSLIYYTPGESELSKSPITLNLYYQCDHSKENIQQATLSDSKKFWMLRQPPLMGG